MPTTIEEIQDMNRTISEIGEFVRERTDALTGDFTALREENDRLRADVAAMQEQRRARRRSEIARVDDSERGIRVTAGRFAGCSPLDIGVMRSLAYSHRDDPDAPHARSWVAQLEATRSMVTDLTPDIVDRHFPEASSAGCAARTWPFPSPERTIRDPEMQYRQVIQPVLGHMREVAMRAAMDSTTAGAGDELVPTLERAELWMDVNLQALVMGLIPNFTMPSNPFDIPTQLGDVNFYPGAENTATTETALGTSKVHAHRARAVAQVPFSFSLDEDNALPSLLGEIRNSLVRNTAEVIDDIILNADTTTANSINADDAALTKTAAGKAHWLIGYDGLIHLPLIDNTAMSNDHADAVSDDMFNEIRRRWVATASARPSWRGSWTSTRSSARSRSRRSARWTSSARTPRC